MLCWNPGLCDWWTQRSIRANQGNWHPRRPRGSQGREKGRDESFQVRAKKPLGTPTLTKLFPKIQADAGSWLGTKNAFYYCAQWLLSCHACLVRSPSLCEQGKLLCSTFLTRNEGTTDESKQPLGCYQQEQFNLPREYSVSVIKDVNIVHRGVR